MRRKIFLTSFILSLPVWWGINILADQLENFLFLREMSKNPAIFVARADTAIILNITPEEKQNLDNLEINAKAAISMLIAPDGSKKLLFKKNTQEKLPIASLTKLMVAYVFLENFDINQPVKISKRAVAQKENFGGFGPGEVFAARDLIYSALIESSNDAAYALAEIAGEEGFIGLMNLEAKDLGLENTYFVNPTGIEPDNPDDSLNFSTAEDLIKLTVHLLDRPVILESISTTEFYIYLYNGNFHHKAVTTNKLLESSNSFGNLEIIGGKTGWDSAAKGCLLLILKDKKNNYLINVILGADDRFGEMKKLTDVVKTAIQ